MTGLEWLYVYITGSILVIIVLPHFLRECNEILMKPTQYQGYTPGNKYLMIFMVGLLCYCFGTIAIPLFILASILEALKNDYYRYKMKFEEEELKKYRMKDATNLLDSALRYAKNEKYKEAHECAMKAEKLFKDTL